jgi:hypothetical protein
MTGRSRKAADAFGLEPFNGKKAAAPSAATSPDGFSIDRLRAAPWPRGTPDIIGRSRGEQFRQGVVKRLDSEPGTCLTSTASSDRA